MSSINTKIVFFGTGEVSLETLKGISSHVQIEAIITKPDLLSSSGSRTSPAVKLWAQENGVPCYQPANKAELGDLFDKQAFESRVGLVVDYGLIIPLSVISSFELGILNSHFSLLPRWRGADPITWSILSGDEVTGVTIMQLAEGMDTGDILRSEKLEIGTEDTTSTLTTKLIGLSNKMLVETLADYLEGNASTTQQDHDRATFSKKITKEDGLVRPNDYSAVEIERQIRAYLGWPGSYITIGDTLLTIKSAKAVNTKAPIGQLTLNEGKLLMGCKQGSLEITQIQPAGKKPMDAKGLVNGYAKLIS